MHTYLVVGCILKLGFVVARGYVYRDVHVFCCWTHPKAWLQLVTMKGFHVYFLLFCTS